MAAQNRNRYYYSELGRYDTRKTWSIDLHAVTGKELMRGFMTSGV
jgi:hypothetical protein